MGSRDAQAVNASGANEAADNKNRRRPQFERASAASSGKFFDCNFSMLKPCAKAVAVLRPNVNPHSVAQVRRRTFALDQALGRLLLWCPSMRQMRRGGSWFMPDVTTVAPCRHGVARAKGVERTKNLALGPTV